MDIENLSNEEILELMGIMNEYIGYLEGLLQEAYGND